MGPTAAPPSASEEGAAKLRELCETLNRAAVREFKDVIAGNWFKIFTHMDLDESGRIGFEELEGVTRARDPGLNLREEDLSLDDMRALWKAIDVDFSGDVKAYRTWNDRMVEHMSESLPRWREIISYIQGIDRPITRDGIITWNSVDGHPVIDLTQ